MNAWFKSNFTFGNVLTIIGMTVMALFFVFGSDLRSKGTEKSFTDFKAGEYTTFKTDTKSDLSKNRFDINNIHAGIASVPAFIKKTNFTLDSQDDDISQNSSDIRVQETQIDNIYNSLEDLKDMIGTTNSLLTEVLKSK